MMFRLETDTLPMLPLHVQQLLQIYKGDERPAMVNEWMDYYCVHVLDDVAKWAAAQHAVVKSLPEDILSGNTKEMILTRLYELAQLEEFKKQFPFRVHDGYSNRRLPDLTTQQRQRHGETLDEDPRTLTPAMAKPFQPPPPPLFQETLALGLCFAGWGQVQLGLDPDPTFDEVGCTGTHLLRAADLYTGPDGQSSNKPRFDCAVIWQENRKDPTIIRREPRAKLPTLGVNNVEVSLMITDGPDGTATAGPVPLNIMQSVGAIQTSGVQQELSVEGFLELLTLTPSDMQGQSLRINLQKKGDMKPFFVGYNHIVWQDGEPIDPFILAVQTGDQTLFRREVFNVSENKDHTMMQMSPLQRYYSARGPLGFDRIKNTPDWVSNLFPEKKDRDLLAVSAAAWEYLKKRALVLKEELEKALPQGVSFNQITLRDVDTIVSLAERMHFISLPRTGSVVRLLPALSHYGHTLSGKLDCTSGTNPIFSALAGKTGLHLDLSKEDSDRNKSNSRWLANYTMGVMDKDAFSYLAFGELYIPIEVTGDLSQDITLTYSWAFAEGNRDLVGDYALKFSRPFWAHYDEIGENIRTRKFEGEKLTETWKSLSDNSYSYTMGGFPNVSSYEATFSLDSNRLEWKITFNCSGGSDKKTRVETLLKVMKYIGRDRQSMTARLSSFGPV